MDWRKIKKQWVHHRNLLSRGHTEISLFYSTIQMSILIWLFLRDLMTFPRVWIFIIAPACGIAAIAIQYFTGYFMERYKIIDDLQEWDFERNPVITRLLEQNEIEITSDVKSKVMEWIAEEMASGKYVVGSEFKSNNLLKK